MYSKEKESRTDERGLTVPAIARRTQLGENEYIERSDKMGVIRVLA